MFGYANIIHFLTKKSIGKRRISGIGERGKISEISGKGKIYRRDKIQKEQPHPRRINVAVPYKGAMNCVPMNHLLTCLLTTYCLLPIRIY